MASHTSGIRQYNFDNLQEANSTTHYVQLEDALGIFKDDPLLAPPGSTFNYSSLGVNLLGVAVERAAGETYSRAINDLVITPMGLTGSQIDDARAHIRCRPNFYTVGFGWLRFDTFWRDSSDYYPSGGMLSMPEDVARLANTTFNSDFFTPETRALLTTPARLRNGTEIAYTFGWEIHRDAHGRVEYYGHGGETNGAYASVRYYPDRRMAVAGIANYNTWLTDRDATFFRAVREEIPRVFTQTQSIRESAVEWGSSG